MSYRAVQELSVAALLDGRPGHEKQTMGIIQELQAKVPVRLRRIKVAPVSLLSALSQTCRLFLIGNGAGNREVEGADLLLGTGNSTHLPMLLYKKKYGIPALCCMSPAAHLRKGFDLCFVPEHDGLKEEHNIMLTVGAPNNCQDKGGHKENCGLVLLGGTDPKSHYWDDRQVAMMVEKIVGDESGMHWTISTSPRTPDKTVSLVKQLSEGSDTIRFFDYRDTRPGWIEEQYDKNKVVWVTADSISMIYEALTAGCRVGILPMQWKNQRGKFKRNEDILLQKKLVTSFSSWQKGEKVLQDHRTLNEAGRCAERILEKWWKGNLR